MARPAKEGLDYFPLDVDIDQDDKIALIEAQHGVTGFAVVIKLLMKIYKNSYFYEWTEKEQLLFSKRVNVDINKVNAIINDCVKWGFFNKELFETYEILTSKGIQRRYLEAVGRRNKVIIEKKYLLLDSEIVNVYKNLVIVDDNPLSNVVNDDINTQSKVKESKVKKSSSTETKITTTTTIIDPIVLFEKTLCRLSPFQTQQLIEWEKDFNGDKEIINEAIRIADDKNKRYFGFVEYLLKEWADNKLETLDQIKTYENNKFSKSSKVVPMKKASEIDWEAL
ncbi:Lin1244/Lin1753 domain-containing protein [Caldifermentibacillus hisashii]|uniref:Lin1244/Lin1753 domain-containing protein n=1 Tax=Caldifermentibacillus hisashii TaxID=996558 RepID=A0ABU9K3L0_9BACI